MEKTTKLKIVREVGVFEGLNIEDPTETEVEEKEVEEIIKESIEANKNIKF